MKTLVTIFTLLALCLSANAQAERTSVYVDSVYSTLKFKELKKRNVIFGIKQIAEEALSSKFSLSESGTPIKIELYFIGNPSKSFRIAGIGGSEDQTIVKIKLYYKEMIYEGEGISQVEVSAVFVELSDELPFSQTVLSSAIKKAIISAVDKM